jgi:integrase/recombinase XerD
MCADLGLAAGTLEAYGRGLGEYLGFCETLGVEPEGADRPHVAAFVRHLRERPAAGGNGAGLANATLQQRLTVVRRFYEYLREEGLREDNPVGRGRYAPGNAFGGGRGLVARSRTLPWVPSDDQWSRILDATRQEPLRNRLMLAFAYDCALRREELCALETGDVDPAHRLLRVRAETTKGRRERVVPYSEASDGLYLAYLLKRRELSRAPGPIFLSRSRRNRGSPVTIWTWSKVVRAIAKRSGLERFTTHTLRHLCLTDLARSGWDVHEIARFAGHTSVETTLQYVHLSGRDLARKLERGMAQVHAWRVESLASRATQ